MSQKVRIFVKIPVDAKFDTEGRYGRNRVKCIASPHAGVCGSHHSHAANYRSGPDAPHSTLCPNGESSISWRKAFGRRSASTSKIGVGEFAAQLRDHHADVRVNAGRTSFAMEFKRRLTGYNRKRPCLRTTPFAGLDRPQSFPEAT